MIDLEGAAKDLRLQLERIQVTADMLPGRTRAAPLSCIARRLLALSQEFQEAAEAESKDFPKTEVSEEEPL